MNDAYPTTLEPTTAAEIAQLLRAVRTIAVLGASSSADKAGYYVPEYLQEQGYRVLPVNPRLAGKELWGEPVVARLADLVEAVDLIDVFRRAELLPDHLGEVLAMQPRPRAVWLQLGIRDDAFARALRAEGVIVVQDRCTLADHQRLQP
jgi:predicted CoA-binding protein